MWLWATMKEVQHDDKPWGWEDIFNLNKPCSVKILHVDKDECFSLQKHAYREELWIVIEEGLTVQLNDRKWQPKLWERIHVGKGDLHRIIGPGKVLEVCFGEFDPNDIERVEDKYGRC